jgi:hypothetical protein
MLTKGNFYEIRHYRQAKIIRLYIQNIISIALSNKVYSATKALALYNKHQITKALRKELKDIV